MTDDRKLRNDTAHDAEAFDAMYHDNAPRLRAFLRQIVGSFQAAEDLTQETFRRESAKKEAGRVLLSVRLRVAPLGPGGYGPETDSSLPETKIWFTPGEVLSLPGTGKLQLALAGQWADRIPVTMGSNALLDPGPNEIRLTSPLLLKNNKVAGEMFNSFAAADRSGEGAFLYIPGEGRFILSSTPIEGAILAKVQLNRVSFESNGQAYIIVTGTPVSRESSLWVLHDLGYKPLPETGPELGARPVSKLFQSPK